jgi:glutamyl-tRNA synthetase
LLKHGKAFKCYTTAAELDEFRKNNPNAKFRSPWRDRSDHPASEPYVIRIKAPLEGETTLHDKVQGTVSIKNSELDDMVLLRSDGTPTYMLAVVVDDHDMGVTQVIRGDDHLTNTFRQLMIYNGMGWKAPDFAHVPMILGPDGAKLSKRHGALGVEAYRDMGYLPEAMRNYLLRLGWSHGDEEIISTEQAIQWFDLDAVGKSPSRFDFTKLDNLNGLYIREAKDGRLVELILPFIEAHPDRKLIVLNKDKEALLLKIMPEIKKRSKNLKELASSAVDHLIDDVTSRLHQNSKAQEILKQGGKEILLQIIPQFEKNNDWKAPLLHDLSKAFGETIQKKLGDIAQPLRVAMTGGTVSMPIFEYMEILGKEETLGRLNKCATMLN